MYNAKKINRGVNKTNPKGGATAVAPTVRRLRPMDATTQGHKRSTKRQKKERANHHVANGFLRTSFLPRLLQQDCMRITSSEVLEGEFKTSLSLLMDKYHLGEIPFHTGNYPYNVAETMQVVKTQLKEKVKEWEEIRLTEHKGAIFFSQREVFNTGQTLYYIPVVPLYRLLKSKANKRTGELLLSVCTYLYQIVDVAYYRQEGCYLNVIYEDICHMAYEEDEELENDFVRECKESELIGDIMERKIRSSKNILFFESRLQEYKARTHFENKCHNLAWEFYKLYKDYPSRRLSDSTEIITYWDDDNGMILSVEHYLSFVASIEGNLADSLIAWVNTDLQEYYIIEEPVKFNPLDGRKIADNDFDFEKRLFSLLPEFIYLLNYKY